MLYMALELSWKTWKVLFWHGGRQRGVYVPGRDLAGLGAAIGKARTHFSLAADGCVVSCYEAGRDGFWLHRALLEMGVGNVVIDSSATEVSRRAKQAKSDGVDVVKLMSLLRRLVTGEEQVFKVVRVPSAAAEDDRRASCELERSKKERGQHRSRVEHLQDPTYGAFYSIEGVPASRCSW